jgi:signal transduction histidine kinase
MASSTRFVVPLLGCAAIGGAVALASFIVRLSLIGALALGLFVSMSAAIALLVLALRRVSIQLRAAHAELGAQMSDLERAEERLQLAGVNRMILMGEMTASIAHEVNQPLTAIIANAGTAMRYLDRAVPALDEVRTYLGLIVRDGKRAGDVIARVRALAKRSPAYTQRLDINATILDVIGLADRELQLKGVELQTDLAHDVAPVVADRVLLQQVILNLIINAAEAMSSIAHGSRELAVRSSTGPARDVVVEVRDCGPGIDPADTDRLFQSFFTTKSEGMGMGLSISRSIIEAHGGRLWATPNEPHGAIFRFTVPAAGADN